MGSKKVQQEMGLPKGENPDDYYIYDGKLEKYQVRVEKFDTKNLKTGEITTTSFRVRQTRHGAVLNDILTRLPKDFPITTLRRYAGYSNDPENVVGRPISALMNIYRSKTVDEAEKSFRDFKLLQGHWVLADDQGDIGYCMP